MIDHHICDQVIIASQLSESKGILVGVGHGGKAGFVNTLDVDQPQRRFNFFQQLIMTGNRRKPFA